MPSSFHLSNGQGEECVITHPENAGPILIDSNNIALKDQLYNSMVQLKTIATGSATFTNSTNNINLTGIGIGVEIGDVIKITGSINNNGDFTVEVITDNNNIIVNQAHAGKSRTVAPIGFKALINETATVTVKLLAKYYNARDGLGQDWVTLTTSRAHNTSYPNNTNRTILATVTQNSPTSALELTVRGDRFSYDIGASGNSITATMEINAGEFYSAQIPLANFVWRERR